MIEKEIIQRMSSLAAGGMITDENRLDEPYLRSLLNSMRAYMIKEQYRKEQLFYPGVFQNYYVDFVQEEQYGYCWHVFYVPQTIHVSPMHFGIEFIGSEDKPKAVFRLSTSIGQYSNRQKHRVMRDSDRKVDILYEVSRGVFKTTDVGVKTMMISGIFANPYEIPTYNFEEDPYPFPDNAIEEMFDLISKGTLKTIISIPKNIVSNSTDS